MNRLLTFAKACTYPFSLLYKAILFCRRSYIERYYPIYKPSTPIIAIGNIAVGGTGKTPLTSYILQLFEEHSLQSCVVSRGYKGIGRDYPIYVDSTSSATIVGDEPYMLAHHHPSAYIIIDPCRKRAIESVLSKHNLACIILDDAMQHLYVGRDINIIILTIDDILSGWDRVLPFGRWREGQSALSRASIFCIRATPQEWTLYKEHIIQRCTPYQKAIYSFYIEIQALHSSKDHNTYTLHTPYSIICGIGNPRYFYESITQYVGYPPQDFHYCPDHATEKELFEAIQQCTTDTVICTAKDYVKIKDRSLSKHLLYTETTCSFGEMLYTTQSFDEYCLSLFSPSTL